MSINLSSVMGKVADYANSKEGKAQMKGVLEKYKKEGKETTEAGSEVLTNAKIVSLTNELIDILQTTAASYGLPASVMKHFNSLSCLVEDQGEAGVICYIFFQDDLSRPSLYEEGYPEGLTNIVALFNNGYSSLNPTLNKNTKEYEADSPVYGWWDGHTATTDEVLLRSGMATGSIMVSSRQIRPTLLFMQLAVDIFYTLYKGKYNFTIQLDDIYSDGSDFVTTI